MGKKYKLIKDIPWIKAWAIFIEENNKCFISEYNWQARFAIWYTTWEWFEEIKEEAPVLASIPKYNPFEVPVDYFEELPTIVQQRAINAKPKTILLEWLLLLIKPRFAFPVLTTLLIAVAGINYMNKNADMPKTEVAEEITTEDQLYNIDEATIIESVNVNQSNENTTVSGEENNIQNYLLENNVDETNLKNEL